MFGGDETVARSRTPQITADAAHVILNRDPRTCTGNFFVDEDVLRAGGVTDFDMYRAGPTGVTLAEDLFLDPLPKETLRPVGTMTLVGCRVCIVKPPGPEAEFRAAAGDGPVARDVPGGSAGGAEAGILACGRQPGLPPRFGRVLGRQVAAGEPVTVQRRNPAQRAGCG
jgi:hypothetical protein